MCIRDRNTTNWNDKGNVEIWRAAWAAYTNRALESAGRPERIDHRSYKRQGIDKIPSVDVYKRQTHSPYTIKGQEVAICRKS